MTDTKHRVASLQQQSYLTRFSAPTSWSKH